MKRMVVIAALLVLSGCSADVVEEAPAVEPETTQETEIAPAPLTTESAEETTLDDSKSEFLSQLRLNTDRPLIMEASDEQLLGLGELACETLTNNPVVTDIQLIKGEDPNDNGWHRDSMVIASQANVSFCPDIEIEHELPTY